MNLRKQQNIKNTWKSLWLLVMGEGKGNGSPVNQVAMFQAVAVRSLLSLRLPSFALFTRPRARP